MITLDVADLVVIAGQALGTGTDAALGQLDVAAAQAALAEARLTSDDPGAASPDHAAAAGIGLLHALLRHRPFPRHGEQVAVAASLQFLSLNGWHADLSPPAAAAVVVEALAAGQLSPDNAAAWLTPRLSPGAVRGARPAHIRMPLPGLRLPRPVSVAGLSAAGRVLISAMLTLAVGGLALLATACSRGPAAPHAQPTATRSVSGVGLGENARGVRLKSWASAP
jgi:prophage maintenance system killer protein